jgi:hypothetical protein
MFRRRRKKSFARKLFTWSFLLLLGGWSWWQLRQIQQTITRNTQPAAETAAPDANDQITAATQNAPDNLWAAPAQVIPTSALELSSGDPFFATISEPPDLLPSPKFDPELTSDDLFDQGTQLLDAGDIANGRFALNAALARSEDEPLCAQLREILTALDVPVFLGSAVIADDPAARFIDVQQGDSFLLLGAAYDVPAALLEALNPDVHPRNLKPQAGVKIVQGPFHIRIVKHAGRMDLYARDIFVRSYAVDFPEGNELPRGSYRIAPGSKVQLAATSRSEARSWIGFEGLDSGTQRISTGWIFGTPGPRGTSAKDHIAGVHMADSDLRELYNVLVEGKSHLRVEP